MRQGPGGEVPSITGGSFHQDCRDTSSEEVLYTTELEDMCEQDPSTWENLAGQRWQEYSQSFNDTVDSTIGGTLDPVKVQAGCDD